MTTKTETKSTALATVLAVELHRVLHDASVFASNDETMPGICTVHIEFTTGYMLAVGTDRFRLGVSKIGPVDGTMSSGGTIPVDGTMSSGGTIDGEASFNLALRDVVTLVKLAKTPRRDEGTRVVWISSALPPSDEYGTGTVTFKFNDGAALDVTPQDTEFPRWRQLFPESGTQVPRDATAFTAEYLASFAKVDGGHSQRLVMFSHDDIHGYRDKPETPVVGRLYGGQRPTTFTIGDNFVGLLMPVKLPDDDSREWRKPEWMG